MRTYYAKANKQPMICNDAPCVERDHPVPLRGTPMITLDRVKGVYVRRRHGYYSSALSATIADRVVRK